MWESYWNILEPALIYNEFWLFDVISEETFRKKILHWDTECIDTTADALYVRTAIERDEAAMPFIKERRNNIEAFLEKLFDHTTGGFRQCQKAPATIYATNAAFRVLKILERIKPEERLGYPKAAELLGEERVKAVVRFIRNSQCPETRGIMESPELRTRPGVFSTKQAHSILWNIGCEEHIQQGVKDFLIKCCFRPNKKRGDAFAETAFDKQPLVCSTYNALRVLKDANNEWIETHRPGFLKFIKSCRKSGRNVSRFRASPKKLGTTDHVFFALKCLKLLGQDVAEADKVANYLWRRQAKRGGFGFHRFGMFIPNIHCTKDVITTLELLKNLKSHKNGDRCVDLFKQACGEKTASFLQRLSSNDTGIFKGLPGKRPKLFERMVKFFLLPKNPDRTERKTRPIYSWTYGVGGLPFLVIGLYLIQAVLRGTIVGGWAFVSLCFGLTSLGVEIILIGEIIQWLKRRV